MIQGTKVVRLIPETVLRKISPYDIFRYYMPDKSWKPNCIMLSPFRSEHNPSFMIGNKHGNLSFVDFGNTNNRGDCFDFVKVLYGLSSLDEVLRLIDNDFGLGILSGVSSGEYKQIISEYKQPEDLRKRYTLIQVSTRKFTHEELAYWNMYHQSLDDLHACHVYSIRTLYLNRQKFSLSDSELRFGYLYDGYWKIYRPFNDKKTKWLPNNVPITMMDGKEDIIGCDVAFINKSKKDYMLMRKIFPSSCAVQNEGMGCFSTENVEYLKANSKRQILSFDSDAPGVTNSQQITKLFDFEYCNVPRIYLKEGLKDWAGLGAKYGLKVIEDILKTKGIITNI